MKITAIIVIYNKEISLSMTCKTIKSYGDVDILVVDNSTQPNHNKEYCSKNDIGFLSMNGNKGLSKAYNAALNVMADTDTDVVVLLDDDTDVPEEYFIKLKEALQRKPDVDIFVPIIRGQDGIIYSPNNYSFLKNKLAADPINEVRQDRFNAISSCMAIRMRVFDDYRYNEKLFVDEIDHCFCREQRKIGRKFDIIDVEINQNFHQRNHDISADFAWRRVRIRIMDIFRHARLIGGFKYTLLAFIKSCGIGVQIGRKCKSLLVILKTIGLSFSLLTHARES